MTAAELRTLAQSDELIRCQEVRIELLTMQIDMKTKELKQMKEAYKEITSEYLLCVLAHAK